MITITEQVDQSITAVWQKQFLKLLPNIERQARFHFRHLRGENCEDAIHEVIANSFCAFRRLAELSRVNEAYASVLVRFAVAQYRVGRRVGCQLNSRDVQSTPGFYLFGFRLESLSDLSDGVASWAETLVDNSSTPVPDQAAFRIDFPEWLSRLNRQNRKLVQFLLLGNSAAEAARRFRRSRGRISQIRSELRDNWAAFHGEQPPDSHARRSS